MSTLIPQVFIGFKVRTLGRLFHPLHSRLNLTLWGWALSSWRMKFWPRLWRYGIASGWRISPQYLSALRSHPIITCLFSEVDVTPPSHYLHQKFLPYQCTTQAYRHPYEPRDWLCAVCSRLAAREQSAISSFKPRLQICRRLPMIFKFRDGTWDLSKCYCNSVLRNINLKLPYGMDYIQISKAWHAPSSQVLLIRHLIVSYL